MAATGPSPYADSSPLVDDAPPAEVEHRASVAELGSFTHAVCSTCGWKGPARRARASAVADVDAHRLLGGGAPVTVDLRDGSER